MTRLRVSAHRLNIETQRFNGKNCYIPETQRVCGCCDLREKEDELHFMIKCPRYKDLREIVFREVSQQNGHFNSYLEDQKLIWLLSNEDIETSKIVARFISESMEIRSQMLKQDRDPM